MGGRKSGETREQIAGDEPHDPTRGLALAYTGELVQYLMDRPGAFELLLSARTPATAAAEALALMRHMAQRLGMSYDALRRADIVGGHARSIAATVWARVATRLPPHVEPQVPRRFAALLEALERDGSLPLLDAVERCKSAYLEVTAPRRERGCALLTCPWTPSKRSGPGWALLGVGWCQRHHGLLVLQALAHTLEFGTGPRAFHVCALRAGGATPVEREAKKRTCRTGRSTTVRCSDPNVGA
jgi:hypothetical protein